MKVAIVGVSQNFTENEEGDLRQMIGYILDNFNPDSDIVISGGARGVDSFAQQIAKGKGFKTDIYNPEKEGWEEGYRLRNIEIAHACDYIYCFSVPHYNDEKRTPCYHHKGNEGFLPHLKTAGCWTLNEAVKLGKRVTLLVTPSRI